MKIAKQTLHTLQEDFEALYDPQIGERRIKERLNGKEKKLQTYLESILDLSREGKLVYPSQGLTKTPYDELGSYNTKLLPQTKLLDTLRLRLFFLEMFNHPYRMTFLDSISRGRFSPPPRIESKMFNMAYAQGLSLSIGDIGASVSGASRPRISRKERYAAGPFVKLGKQGRTFFCGSASPDVWNSSLAIATMAASHCLCGVPRNGVLADMKRQADLAREVFSTLDSLAEIILGKRLDKEKVLGYWKRNVIGVIEASPIKGLKRAEELYKVGIRCFRVYSPEPGTATVQMSKQIRKVFKKEVEIFAGQIVSVRQGQLAEEAGADGLYVGIGGGGRCITGVRSGSVIDWPELVWQMRGEINIPIVVEGGASDHVAVTLLLGASGIGVSRIVAGGTIESPGGALYCVDSTGKFFKPYGGEASARTKYLDGKLLPFGIPSFVEGETTKAQMSYIKGALPTLTYNLHSLIEDSILALVFRGAKDITELQAINPSPLRQITGFGQFQQKTH